MTFRLSQADAIMLTNYVNSPNTKISLLLRPRPPRQHHGSGSQTTVAVEHSAEATTTPAAQPATPNGPTPVSPKTTPGAAHAPLPPH